MRLLILFILLILLILSNIYPRRMRKVAFRHHGQGELGADTAESGRLVLGSGPHLFIDDCLIEEAKGLTRTLHQPVKSPDPILGGDDGKRHREVLFHVSVLHDQGRERWPFRMWYVAGFEGAEDRWSYGYAESNDGLQWCLPELGLVDIGGSNANNVVRAAAYCLFLVDHGPEFQDATRRYVLLYTGGTSFSATYSPDGMHWTDDPRNPLYQDREGVMEDRLTGCWDPLRECYLLTTGHSGRPEDGFRGKPPFHREGYRRMVGQMTSKDLVHWTRFRPIVVTDPEEPGFWEFYGMKPTVRGRLYLGFLRVLRDDLPADQGGPVHGIGWTELCTSRDGEHWTRQPGVFLDRDRTPGTWDHAMAWVGDVVTVGDQELICYGGYAMGHKVGARQMGVATLRRDGFVSRDAGPEGGTLRTPVFTWDAEEVTVNARIDGELRVRVLAESGLPVPGFFWRDCEPIQGDALAHVVRWRADLCVLKGKPVRLEFCLRDAELYGFDMTELSPSRAAVRAPVERRRAGIRSGM